MSDWNDSRPMSPHLWVWRWHTTMLASIAHRATGVLNAVGLALIVGWVVALAGGAESYAAWTGLFAHPVVQLCLFGFTASILFHAVNGARYLFWDVGIGLDPRMANIVSVINGAVALAGAGLIWLLT